MIPALIIDGRCLFDRAWWAARNSEELGEYPSHIVSAGAAIASLACLLGPGGRLPYEPTHLLVSWDGPEAKTIKPRPEKAADHGPDLAFFKSLLPLLVGGAHYEVPTGVFGESDDVVATAVELYKDRYKLTILSSDKDLQQLVREASYFNLQTQQEVTEEDVQVRWHVGRPSHLALYLALEGDPKDGVDGTDKIGAKGAKRLLEGMGDVPVTEALALLLPQLNPLQRDQLYSSLELTLLRRDLPGVPEPAPINLAGFDMLDEAGIQGSARNVWGQLLGRSKAHTVLPDLTEYER
jgi:hypothetical protein